MCMKGKISIPMHQVAQDANGHAYSHFGEYSHCCDYDIEVSHRLKKPRNAKPTEPRPIIVRFRSKAERYRVISNRKNLRPSNDTKDIKVYINEDLTTARAKLFSTVRLLFRQKHFTQVWTYNGCIKVKDLRGTVKSINSIDDVKNCLPDINIP